MNLIVRNIKWIMLVTGLLTASIFYYAISPQDSLATDFGHGLDDPLAVLLVRNWGILVGLVAACEWLASSFTQRTGIQVELTLGGGELDLPDPYATALFRVLQESLTNVAKHADARQVEVTLEHEGACVVLTVSDNGRGFTPGEAPPGSFGLIGQRERAYLVEGEVRVDSAPGKGTRVELRVPVPKP